MNTKDEKKKRPSGFGNIPVHDPAAKEVPRKDDGTARQSEVIDTKRLNTEFDHRKTRKP